MKILFLTIGSQKTPSTRFRIKSYFPSFDRAGITYVFAPIPHGTVQRFSLLPKIAAADVIFLQKKLFSSIELKLITSFHKPLLFDMDDVIFHEHPLYAETKRGKKRIVQQKKRFEMTLGASDCVIVGNQYLADDLARYGVHAQILPTPVDTELFVPAVRGEKEENLVIGWIGTKRNLYYLDQLISVFRKVKKEFPKVTFRFISDGVKEFEDIPVENQAWSAEREISDLQGFDIGIMPLTDDIYSRGKCGFKLLQYMSVGLATVCSPIGVNRHIVQHGTNGFVAQSDEDWYNALKTLILDDRLRKTMGARARVLVEEHYSVTVLFPRLLDIIRKTAGELPR